MSGNFCCFAHSAECESRDSEQTMEEYCRANSQTPVGLVIVLYKIYYCKNNGDALDLLKYI